MCERDRIADEASWFIADLRRVARYRGLKYKRAVKALGLLRSAGLVATQRSRLPRIVHDAKRGLIEVNANDQNYYLIAGKYHARTGRRGHEAFEFPRAQWLAYLDRRPIEAWRYPIPAPLKKRSACEGSRNDLQDLDTKKGTSLILNTGTCTGLSFPSEKREGNRPKIFEASTMGMILQDGTEVDSSLLLGEPLETDLPKPGVLSFGSNTELVQQPGPCPHVPLDPPLAQDAVTIVWIPTEALPAIKARMVVEAYRLAVKRVYGITWRGWLRGDIERARTFRAFVRCGEAMADHAVTPMHWAIWRLEFFKAKVPRFAQQAPPINSIMSTKVVSERAGWFRKEYVLPQSIYKACPYRREQMLRNQEAYRRWRGFTGEGIWMALPRDYYEKRMIEIAEGITDPHDLWPKRPPYADEVIDWWNVKGDRRDA